MNNSKYCPLKVLDSTQNIYNYTYSLLKICFQNQIVRTKDKW